MVENPLLDAARDYLKWGWAVIPTVKKVPVVPYKELGLDKLHPNNSVFVDTFLKHFKDHPEATGARSNCILINVYIGPRLCKS